MHADAGKERVRVATRDHHRSEVIAVEEELMRFAVAESFALPALPQIVRVLVAFVACCGIDNRDVTQRDQILTGDPLDYRLLAQQYGQRDSFVDQLPGGAHDLGLFAFWK